MKCEHNFQYMGSSKRKNTSGYSIYFKKIDYFYCTKCLEQKEIEMSEYSREVPDWYLIENNAY